MWRRFLPHFAHFPKKLDEFQSTPPANVLLQKTQNVLEENYFKYHNLTTWKFAVNHYVFLYLQRTGCQTRLLRGSYMESCVQISARR